jgi:hypothetical protein
MQHAIVVPHIKLHLAINRVDVAGYIKNLSEQFKRWKPGVRVSDRLLVQFSFDKLRMTGRTINKSACAAKIER